MAGVTVRVPWLIVDLAGLNFTDCAEMRVLAAVAKRAREVGGGLVPAAPGPLVLRVFDLTGLMTGVPVYPSVEEAAGVASLQRVAACPEPDARAIVAGLPSVRPDASRKKRSVGPHQQLTAPDTHPRSP